MDAITISVILPVYNVEPWLVRCIESLKAQTLPGLEFIFIDDCSTDGSLSVIEDFAEEDPRVRIIKNEVNSGAGITRNKGLDAAKGEYLSFIDPDDWISDDFYLQLYTEAKRSGCDIVKGIRVKIPDGMEVKSLPKYAFKSKQNRRIRNRIKDKVPLFLRFTYEHQTAIFKSSLFDDKSVRYGTSRVAQDVTFLLRICYNTESISLIEGSVYYYRIRAGAATSEYTLKRSLAHMATAGEMIAYLRDKEGFPTEHQLRYLHNRLRTYLSDFYYACTANTISDEDRDEYQRRMAESIAPVIDQPLLYDYFNELRVFLQHGFVIPPREKRDDPVFPDGVLRWTDFIVERPSDFRPEYYKSYTHAILKSVYLLFGAKILRLSETKLPLSFYFKQLGRIPRRMLPRVFGQLFISGLFWSGRKLIGK